MGLKPFTKWAGGKRQLIPELTALMPKEYDRYFEPFVGGGALFFETLPPVAVINDSNTYLIRVYEQIKENVDGLISLLEEHQRNNSKEYYLKIRSVDRDGTINHMSHMEQAARLLYMLRVDFNGLYRVNSKNQFNVPYGRYKKPKIVNEELLRSISNYLNMSDVTVLNEDFELAVSAAQGGDFVYFDPPYAPVSETSSFTAYTNDGFGLKEQERLRDTFVALTQRGVKVMLSNSDVPIIHKLYEKIPGVDLRIVRATRMINSKASDRGQVNEVLIRNYHDEF